MANEILNKTKDMLGLPAEELSFDSQLVVYINDVLFTLNDLGVGVDGYRTTATEGDISDFLTEEAAFDTVQMYIFLKVRLSFDTPTSSFVLEAMKNRLAELESRLLDISTTT